MAALFGHRCGGESCRPTMRRWGIDPQASVPANQPPTPHLPPPQPPPPRSAPQEKSAMAVSVPDFVPTSQDDPIDLQLKELRLKQRQHEPRQKKTPKKPNLHLSTGDTEPSVTALVAGTFAKHCDKPQQKPSKSLTTSVVIQAAAAADIAHAAEPSTAASGAAVSIKKSGRSKSSKSSSGVPASAADVIVGLETSSPTVATGSAPNALPAARGKVKDSKAQAPPTESSWAVGAACMAKYAGDGKFYPAEVVQVAGKNIVVSFTEYESEFQTCLANHLRPTVTNAGARGQIAKNVATSATAKHADVEHGAVVGNQSERSSFAEAHVQPKQQRRKEASMTSSSDPSQPQLPQQHQKPILNVKPDEYPKSASLVTSVQSGKPSLKKSSTKQMPQHAQEWESEEPSAVSAANLRQSATDSQYSDAISSVGLVAPTSSLGRPVQVVASHAAIQPTKPLSAFDLAKMRADTRAAQQLQQLRVQKLLSKPVGTTAAAEAAADTSIVVAAAASVGTGSRSVTLSEDDSSLHWHTHVMRLTNPLARETAQLYAHDMRDEHAHPRFRRFCPEKAASVSDDLRAPLSFSFQLPLTDPQPLVEGIPTVTVRLSVNEAGATSVALASSNLLESTARAIGASASTQATALPALAFRRIVQWLDREFWNLYKKAAASAASSSGKKISESGATLGLFDSTSATATVSSDASGSTATEWSTDEQRRLEAALVTHPSSLEPKNRWRLIATDVGSKTAGQCIARFKFIRETLKGGGSVAAAEARAAAPTSRDSAAPAKIPSTVISAQAPASSAATGATEAPSKMPPIEIPDDLLTMTGVIAGAGMCAVRMEDVVYDGWDVSVAHTISLQIQCQRCKCRLAIVFPPEGVPSLEMLLDAGSCEQVEAEHSAADDDDDNEDDNGAQAVEEIDETDDSEQNVEAGDASDHDDSSSNGDSDADNGMGRKTGAVRVMVESFADSESRWADWCPGCRRGLAVGVRRQLLHEMNGTVAIADCRGCSVVDVLPSSFIISCSSCSAPVVLPDRQQRARRYNVVCRLCHTHIAFAFGCIKLLASAPSDFARSGAGPPRGRKISMQYFQCCSSSISQSVPLGALPENGTCKHYRKSFRWLRFPCCGKCYPCDTCHDAAEDHPAVWANRMLCGFCGLEQPFSSKPCSCGSQLAKSSSMTRFWEGGKGNRNTRALSKNDSKKYAGLNKTISRRAGRLLVPKSK